MLISRENRSNFTGVLNNHPIADRAPLRQKQFASLVASALVALALCAPDSASAIVAMHPTTFLSFGSNTSAGAISVGWGGGSVDVACMACVTQSTSSGASDFSFNVILPVLGSFAVPSHDGLGTYTQTIDALDYGANINLTQGTTNIFSASFSNMIISGVPGNNFVNLTIPYFSGSSSLTSPVPSSGYVNIYGTTASPLTLTTNEYIYNTNGLAFAPFTVDWSGTVSNTPIISASPIPEPSEWALMLGGLGLIGFIARRKNQSSALTFMAQA